MNKLQSQISDALLRLLQNYNRRFIHRPSTTHHQLVISSRSSIQPIDSHKPNKSLGNIERSGFSHYFNCARFLNSLIFIHSYLFLHICQTSRNSIGLYPLTEWNIHNTSLLPHLPHIPLPHPATIVNRVTIPLHPNPHSHPNIFPPQNIIHRTIHMQPTSIPIRLKPDRGITPLNRKSLMVPVILRRAVSNMPKQSVLINKLIENRTGLPMVNRITRSRHQNTQLMM